MYDTTIIKLYLFQRKTRKMKLLPRNMSHCFPVEVSNLLETFLDEIPYTTPKEAMAYVLSKYTCITRNTKTKMAHPKEKKNKVAAAVTF